MRKYIATAALAAAVIAMPIVGLATTRQAAPASAKKEATSAASKAAPTHATKGVVKSVDESTLVISRHGKKPEDMTFTLNANTHKEGAVAVGAPVSVRYQESGKTNVATAVSVEQAKTKSSAKK
jgi:hypothetical protein